MNLCNREIPRGQNLAVDQYSDTMERMMHLSFPFLTENELKESIQNSIGLHYKDTDCTLYNNYKKLEAPISLEKLTNYIMSKAPIMTPSGVLFTKHGSVKNPLYDMIEVFATTRDKFKHEMFKYPKGSEQFKSYNLLQLIAKVDTNAIYGALGNYSSIFYNIFVAESITKCGKAAISASIMLFESLLSDNVKFGSLDEVMTFIDNVRNETRTLDDRFVLDENINLKSCFARVILGCGYRWIPSEKEQAIIWDVLSRVSQSDLNRIYYKNELYSFCDNSRITGMIMDILQTLKLPFLDPNHPPIEIKDKLANLLAYIKEYVYYPYLIPDKLDRVETLYRDSVLITDTDSCIVSLDAWYNFVLQKTVGVDMPIKHQLIDIVDFLKKDEFGDFDKLPIVEYIDYQYDYDFYDQELIQRDRLINPVQVIPQDGLRHSIINIISYCISKLILDFMVKFTANYQSTDPNRDCLMIMKNEYLFKSILLKAGNGKKNYSSIQEVQEGNIVPKEASLNISGMTLNKVGVPESTSEELKRILYEEILSPEGDIVPENVLKDLAILEKKIYNSLMAGDIKYHKPARVKPISSYKAPMSQQSIKGSVAYNALRDDGEEAIDLEKRNSVIIIKTNIDKNTLPKIKDSNNEMYNKITNLMNKKEYKNGISSIAIPYGVDVPEWIKPFIDYTTVIHDNLNPFPAESIGIKTFDNSNIPYSNIIDL